MLIIMMIVINDVDNKDKTKLFVMKVTPLDYYYYIYKCKSCYVYK